MAHRNFILSSSLCDRTNKPQNRHWKRHINIHICEMGSGFVLCTIRTPYPTSTLTSTISVVEQTKFVLCTRSIYPKHYTQTIVAYHLWWLVAEIVSYIRHKRDICKPHKIDLHMRSITARTPRQLRYDIGWMSFCVQNATYRFACLMHNLPPCSVNKFLALKFIDTIDRNRCDKTQIPTCTHTHTWQCIFILKCFLRFCYTNFGVWDVLCLDDKENSISPRTFRKATYDLYGRYLYTNIAYFQDIDAFL